jgi:hypothetical protein
MLKTLRKKWRLNWTLFLWRPLLTVFKKFFKSFNKCIQVGRN